MKIQLLNSLKTRYILFASLLSVLVILVSFFGYRNVSLTTQETTRNIETRRQLLDHINHIRISVFDAYKALVKVVQADAQQALEVLKLLLAAGAQQIGDPRLIPFIGFPITTFLKQ